MHGTCECGMTLEQPSSRTGCQECGTPGCRSCSIELEATHYCRWCATSLALGQPAWQGERQDVRGWGPAVRGERNPKEDTGS